MFASTSRSTRWRLADDPVLDVHRQLRQRRQEVRRHRGERLASGHVALTFRRHLGDLAVLFRRLPLRFPDRLRPFSSGYINRLNSAATCGREDVALLCVFARGAELRAKDVPGLRRFLPDPTSPSASASRPPDSLCSSIVLSQSRLKSASVAASALAAGLGGLATGGLLLLRRRLSAALRLSAKATSTAI